MIQFKSQLYFEDTSNAYAEPEYIYYYDNRLWKLGDVNGELEYITHSYNRANYYSLKITQEQFKNFKQVYVKYNDELIPVFSSHIGAIFFSMRYGKDKIDFLHDPEEYGCEPICNFISPGDKLYYGEQEIFVKSINPNYWQINWEYTDPYLSSTTNNNYKINLNLEWFITPKEARIMKLKGILHG